MPGWDRLRRDDEGQVLVMSIGFVVIVLALIGIAATMTTVHLERKRLMTLADNAAAYAAGRLDEDAFHRADPSTQTPGAVDLTDAGVERAVRAYLRDTAPHVDLRDVRLVSATTPDGRTAQVELSGRASPVLVGWFTDLVDPESGITVVSRGSARVG